jgi:alpha-1,2-mannosyltransferase
MKRLLIWIYIFSTFGAFFYSLSRIVRSSAPDFSVYFGGARYLLEGHSLYDNIGLYTGIGYPPQTFLIFLPFTLFPYQVSQAIWIFLSYISLIITVIILLKMFYSQSSWILITMIIGSLGLTFPVKFTLGMGQSNLVALALLVIFIYLYQKGQKVTASIILGLATIVKPHLLMLIIGCLLTRQWMIAVITLTIQIFGVMITGVLFGWTQFTTYLFREIPSMMLYRGLEIYYNQGFRAMVSRVAPSQIAPNIITLLSVIVLSLACYVIITKKFDLIKATLILLPVFLLIEPLSWQHHYVFLIPTIFYLAGKIYQSTSLIYYIFALFIVSINLDLAGFQRSGIFWSIILSHVGIGNLIIYVLSLRYL